MSPYTTEAEQATRVCNTFRNTLGTPGIENYVYHRMTDHPAETAAGLGLGLRRTDGSAKQAWSTWALCNRNDLTPPQLSCGFEHLPYTLLTRSYHKSRGHWASIRIAPSGFTDEKSWHLLRDAKNGTHMLFECQVGQHNLVSQSTGCENLVPLGPLGFAFDTPADGRVALHRCYLPSNGDHFISEDLACEGARHEEVLGYALTH